MNKLETFINLDHVLSVEFTQNNDSVIECVIYYRDNKTTRLIDTEAMKFYTLLVRKMTSNRINFVIIDGRSI